MLKLIKCDKFRHESISFSSGLNVVLGDEKASNSIGKSTLLMILDFVFGGETYLDYNSDTVAELGHHTYQFQFEFEKKYYFERATVSPNIVELCDANFNRVDTLSLKQFKSFLSEKYQLSSLLASFRSIVGLYSRVWGKGNIDTSKPMHLVSQQSAKFAINNLLKVYGKYGELEDLEESLDKVVKDNTALKSAWKSKLIPQVLKSKYQDNKKVIETVQIELSEIKDQLAKYTSNLNEIVSKELLELKADKDVLLADELNLNAQLNQLRSNLTSSKHFKSKNLQELASFFPTANINKLAEIESFHKEISSILAAEIREAEKLLEQQVTDIKIELRRVDTMVRELTQDVKAPDAVVDRVCKLSNRLKEALLENEYYDLSSSLKDKIKQLKADVKIVRETVCDFVQSIINKSAFELVSEIYGEKSQSPRLMIVGNNYRYDVDEDTGTGKAYSNLVIFDLSVLRTSKLPFLIHDSLLFKNIENNAVASMIPLYISQQKQSFISIDEVSKYGAEAASSLKENAVIQLDEVNTLFNKVWKKQATQ